MRSHVSTYWTRWQTKTADSLGASDLHLLSMLKLWYIYIYTHTRIFPLTIFQSHIRCFSILEVYIFKLKGCSLSSHLMNLIWHRKINTEHITSDFKIRENTLFETSKNKKRKTNVKWPLNASCVACGSIGDDLIGSHVVEFTSLLIN